MYYEVAAYKDGVKAYEDTYERVSLAEAYFNELKKSGDYDKIELIEIKRTVLKRHKPEYCSQIFCRQCGRLLGTKDKHAYCNMCGVQ